MNKTVKKLLDFLNEIRPHIIGHKTATEKFIEAVNEVENNPPQNDFVIGLLVGEIIWYRKLNKYTEWDLIESICSEEERNEYNKLSDEWSKKIDTNRHLPNYSQSAPEEWNRYRNYSRQLHLKYFPHRVEYSSLIPYTIKDVDKFFKGIESFLWNTDHCCYGFKKEDIIFEEHGIIGTSLEINFTLDYLDPKYDLNETSLPNNNPSV